MASVDELLGDLRAYFAGGGEGIGAKSAKIDLKEDGFIVINGNRVETEDRATDCTLIVSKDDLEKIRAGTLNPTMALMSGKVKIRGDMALVMKLQGLLKAHG